MERNARNENMVSAQAATLYDRLVKAAEAYLRFTIAAQRFLPFAVQRLVKRKAAAKAVIAQRSEKFAPQRGAFEN